jgi:hypothetical protein
MQKGLDNHLQSCPGCPNPAMLRFLSVTTSSKAINHYLFRVKTDAKLATNHLVGVMWHDENAFDT